MAGPVSEDSQDSHVLDLVGEAVRSKQCILFLGAGVHAAPPEGSRFTYPPEQRPPIAAALSRELADGCGFVERFANEDCGNLQRVALAYEIDSSRGRLVDAITSAVVVGRNPSPMLTALARLDFPLVITTNYDALFERALQAVGKQPRVAVYNPESSVPTTDFRNATSDSPVVYKLHGDIARRESLVVTDEDYIQFVLRMSDKEPYDPVPLSLKFFLTGWTTLFVGYSLMDYNLRLLFKTLRWKIDAANLPDMYSVDMRPDPLILDVWQSQRHYVKFIAQDVWSFVPRLYELVCGEELEP
jgi:SIR2-like domain